MASVRKIFSLSADDRRLFVDAMLVVGTIRCGLWLLPFKSLRRLLLKISKVAPQLRGTDSMVAERVAWAVKVSSRYIPNATCLTQALATKVLLGRRGQPAVLRIGVTRNEQGEFLAHAWVESNGQSVIGGSQALLQRYNALPEVGEEIL